MKCLLFTVVATLAFSVSTSAQNDCNLINSITLNAQPTQTVNQNVTVGYLTGSQTNIADSTIWHYVAVTKSNNSGSLYMDGNLLYSGNYVVVPYIWNSLLFGATQPCVSCSPIPDYFGSLDEVRVSNTVRTSTDILNYFNSNAPFVSDVNTIGLFHLDNIVSSTTPNSLGGGANVYGNPYTGQGKFGQSIKFNGTTDCLRWSNSLPVNNLTVEFWFKSSDLSATMLMLEYAYNTGIYLGNTTTSNPITWSTGATGNSVTVDPTQMPYVWVTDGNCTDTIFFNSQSATIYDTTNVTVYDTTNVMVYDTTNVTIYDTLTTYVTVTDTLIINANLAGLNPPNNVNTLLIYPNPASTHITIDYGNYALMNGYSIQITNVLGQQVFQTPINQQSSFINLSSWTGTGVYFVHLVNPQGVTIDTREIVLQ